MYSYQWRHTLCHSIMTCSRLISESLCCTRRATFGKFLEQSCHAHALTSCQSWYSPDWCLLASKTQTRAPTGSPGIHRARQPRHSSLGGPSRPECAPLCGRRRRRQSNSCLFAIPASLVTMFAPIGWQKAGKYQRWCWPKTRPSIERPDCQYTR